MIIKEIPLTKVLYSAYNSLDFADSKKYNLSFNCYWKVDFVTFTFVFLSVIVDKYIQVLYQFFPHGGNSDYVWGTTTWAKNTKI